MYHVRSQIRTLLYYSKCANAKKKKNLKHVPIQNKTILKHVPTQNKTILKHVPMQKSKTILKHVPMQNVSQINQFCFMCGCKIYLKSIPFWLILHILYIEPYTVQLYITTVHMSNICIANLVRHPTLSRQRAVYFQMLFKFGD